MRTLYVNDMDLRPFSPNAAQRQRAARELNYQPFILSDDLQTGAAYSWVKGTDPRVKPQLVFQRRQHNAEEWERITDANRRLAAMYDDMLDAVAKRFPGGRLLDVACNNGYFPVGAELRGMRGYGVDLGPYASALSVLNDICGTHASFRRCAYDPRTHNVRRWAGYGPRLFSRHDVVVASAIMCHLPDPLYFLAELARLGDAILFWGQMLSSDHLLVSYQQPHTALSLPRLFPHCFNDNTRISRGLFDLAMRRLGFREVIELTGEHWLKELMAPTVFPDEVSTGSQHRALLAVR